MKRKDSNCVGIIPDQGGAATASNLREYTIAVAASFACHPQILYDRLAYVDRNMERIRNLIG